MSIRKAAQIFCPIVLYGLFGFGSYIFIKIEILNDFPNNRGLRIFELVLFEFILLLAIWSHLAATFTKPYAPIKHKSYLPEHLHPIDQAVVDLIANK
jgi:hypothetical protein